MSKAQILSAQEALNQTQGRVLLINPPVIDRRYPWVRWNQPLDLLKLGSVLSKTHGCEVKLFDFMLPTPKGVVPRRQSPIESNLPSDAPTRWQYGRSWREFDAYLDDLTGSKWIPDNVWVTTLTSFWWQTVPLVANRVKNKLKRPKVVLYGNYPVLETPHAAQFCPNVDIVVKEHADLTCWPADFSLYKGHKPRFYALDLCSPDPLVRLLRCLNVALPTFAFSMTISLRISTHA